VLIYRTYIALGRVIWTRFALCLVPVAVASLGQTTETPGCSISYENHNQIDYGPLRLRAVQGVVLDSAAVPVPDVCLGLFHDKEHSVVASTTSDTNGRFSFGKVVRGRYRLVAKFQGLGVANVPLELVAWPSGGFLHDPSLIVHMRPSGIDTTSYGERKR
jgi:Carboxypeptidase regulatory-like domain